MAKSVYYIIEANSGEYYGDDYHYDDPYFVLGIGCAKKNHTKPLAKEKLRALKELYPESFNKGKIKKVVIRY